MRIAPTGRTITLKAGITSTVVVTLAEMKEHLYIDSGFEDDDDMLEGFEKSAVSAFENFTGRPLFTSTCIAWYKKSDIQNLIHLNCGRGEPILYLPFAQVTAINTVSIFESDGTEIELVEGTDYEASGSSSQGGTVLFLDTPFNYSSEVRRLDSLKIVCSAGFGDTTASIPQDVKEGMLQTIAHWYENRGDTSESSKIAGAPLWRKYRIERISYG